MCTVRVRGNILLASIWTALECQRDIGGRVGLAWQTLWPLETMQHAETEGLDKQYISPSFSRFCAVNIIFLLLLFRMLNSFWHFIAAVFFSFLVSLINSVCQRMTDLRQELNTFMNNKTRWLSTTGLWETCGITSALIPALSGYFQVNWEQKNYWYAFW